MLYRLKTVLQCLSVHGRLCGQLLVWSKSLLGFCSLASGISSSLARNYTHWEEVVREHWEPRPAVFVYINVCMSIFKKLQHMCMFIRLLNEPVWVCAPDFPTALSQEVWQSIFVYLCVISLSSFVWSTVCVYIYVCVIWIRYDGRRICWLIKALSKPTPTPPLVFGQPIWFSWRKRSTKSASICCGLLSSWWRNYWFFWFCFKQHFTTNKSTMTASKYWLWWQYSCS